MRRVEPSTHAERRIRELDKKIVSVSKSTRTHFAFFIPVHNWLRRRLQWYYNWHLNAYAPLVHTGVLVGIFIAAGSVVILTFGSLVTLGFLFFLGGVAP